MSLDIFAMRYKGLIILIGMHSGNIAEKMGNNSMYVFSIPELFNISMKG